VQGLLLTLPSEMGNTTNISSIMFQTLSPHLRQQMEQLI